MQRPDGGKDACGVVPVLGCEDVYVQLYLVSIGVGNIERVSDGVVTRACDRDSICLEVGEHLTQIVVALADLQAEVVQAEPASFRDGGSRAPDFDEEELVVGPP